MTANGLGGALRPLLSAGTSLPALLATAGLAAVLANLINNLPAVLVLLPLAAPSGAGAVLAVLLGVNIGPNLTSTGVAGHPAVAAGAAPARVRPVLAGIHPAGVAHRARRADLAVLSLWAALHAFGG